MSFVIVNYCPHCGAPIWIDSAALHLGVLPKTFFSCCCNPAKNGSVIPSIPVAKQSPEQFEVIVVCSGSATNTRTVLCD